MGRKAITTERQVQIARALLRVMATHGYEGASIALVAKEADIAPGLVHYHFKSKLEILLAAIGELAADHDARLDERLAHAGDAARELRAFIDVHLRAGAEADPVALACWINATGEALREPRVRRLVTKVLSASLRRLSEILERGTTAGVLSCRDPASAASAILATIQGYFVLAAMARELIPEGTAADTALSMAMALAGAPRPLRSARPGARKRSR